MTDTGLLLVEDDPMIAMMVADMCDALGHGEPVQCSSIAAALAALDQRDFVAALLDVHLGGDAVWPVADALAQRGVPFAFMTGGGGDVPAAHNRRPTLSKPFRVAELDSLLGEMMASSVIESAGKP